MHPLEVLPFRHVWDDRGMALFSSCRQGPVRHAARDHRRGRHSEEFELSPARGIAFNFGSCTNAFDPRRSCSVEIASTADLPDAPLPAGYLGQVTDPSGLASVVGTVKDLNGNQVGGAKATIENVSSHAVRTVTTDSTGVSKWKGWCPEYGP